MEVVAITGLTGKSGSYMYSELLKNEVGEKYKFKIAVREFSKKEMFKNTTLNIELCEGDLEDTSYLYSFCNNVDTLFHIAGINKSLRLVEIAVKCGVKRLILVHTTGIYSKYKSAGEMYKEIERKIHKIIDGKEIDLTILRPTMIYGNLQDGNMSIFIKMVDKLRLFPIVNNAKYPLQPVWAKDLGIAYYNVLINVKTTANKNYVLSGAKPIDLIDIFKVIETKLGKKNIYISIPYWLAYFGAWLLYICTIFNIDFREKVQRLVEPRAYGYEAAKKDFGYNPVTFEVGIQDEIDMYIKSRH